LRADAALAAVDSDDGSSGRQGGRLHCGAQTGLVALFKAGLIWSITDQLHCGWKAGDQWEID